MPITLVDTVAGAAQFDGTTNAGLFNFLRYWKLARTTGIVIHSISYVEISSGPALTTQVSAWAVRSVLPAPTIKVPLGDATAAGNLLDADGNARLKLCGHVLERNPGSHVGGASTDGIFWDVQVFTKNKTEDATVTITFDLCPFPETDARDSTDR
jgi:hypothetical protein